MAHTSEPDRIRSLPNRYLDLRDQDFSPHASPNLFLGCMLEEESQGFNQVRTFDFMATIGAMQYP